MACSLQISRNEHGVSPEHLRIVRVATVIDAATVYGYAQIALAYICKDAGKKLTLFVAERGELHFRTAKAQSLGANIVQIPMGYLSNTRAQARRYFERIATAAEKS